MLYPAMELSAGVLCAACCLLYRSTPLAAIFALSCVVLLTIAVIDAKYGTIPDCLNVAILLLGVTASATVAPSFAERSVTALLVGSGLWGIALFYRNVRGRDGIGGGDIKLLAALGMLFGSGGAVYTIAVASITGFALGTAGTLTGRIEPATRIPFGPFIAVAAVLWIMAGTSY